MKKIKFDSKFEETLWKGADKAKTTYHPDALTYVLHHKYTPDFVIKTSFGGSIFIEAKGYFTPKDRNKMLQVKKQHPLKDLRLVFMAPNNKLAKKSKTTYSAWCNKHGFKWAAKTIPKEWYNE